MSLLERVDPGATFRLGFTGDDMDFNKGPNVITAFTNSKVRPDHGASFCHPECNTE